MESSIVDYEMALFHHFNCLGCVTQGFFLEASLLTNAIYRNSMKKHLLRSFLASTLFSFIFSQKLFKAEELSLNNCCYDIKEKYVWFFLVR